MNFEDEAVLTHHIPAGPQIVAPANGAVVPDAALRIDWNPVTTAILTSNPYLRSVVIVGYHVIVVEAGAEGLPQLDIDVPATETSLTVPAQYLKPNTIYEFEVLATEQGGNQTITEGFFCTAGVWGFACCRDSNRTITIVVQPVREKGTMRVSSSLPPGRNAALGGRPLAPGSRARR